MKPLALIEKAVKGPIWGCQMCGQCVLHSTGMTCPMNCPKTLRNGPCGGVRPDGMCEVKPEIVGFSAFLTTTMPMFKANINAIEKAGLRDQVVVMVGGAPVTQEYADAVGADGYAADASATVKKAKDLLKQKRAKVSA